MAEVKVSRSPGDVLLALGLGSCIGVCAYDPQCGVAGLAHVVLPDSGGHQGGRGKFADTAIPYLLEEMIRLGASQARLRFALAGGAQLFSGNSGGPRLDIGPRNAAAVRTHLERHRLSIVAEDLGGGSGRTVTLHSDGRVYVKTLGRGEEQLAILSAAGDRAGTATAQMAATQRTVEAYSALHVGAKVSRPTGRL